MRREYEGLRRGLIGAWHPATVSGGRTVPDLSNAANTATFNSGVSWSPSPYGQALLWNGTSGVMTFGKASLTGLNVATVSFWFLRTALTTAAGVQHGDAETNRSFFATADDGQFYVGGRYSAGDYFSYASLNNYALNIWHHAVAVIVPGATTTNGARRLWVNGQEVTLTHARSDAHPAFPSCTTFLDSGERFTGSGTGWRNGRMTDVRLWNRSLTLSEIRLLATRPGVGLVNLRQRRTSASSKRLWLNVGGTWKETVPYINVGGTWKEAAVYRHDGTAFTN